MTWRDVKLFGATRISRVCGIYEIIETTKVPGTKFKVKVLERGPGDFVAIPNICLKAPDGSPDGMAGLGRSEVEALQDALKWFMGELAKRDSCTPDDFEWSDPVDF